MCWSNLCLFGSLLWNSLTEIGGRCMSKGYATSFSPPCKLAPSTNGLRSIQEMMAFVSVAIYESKKQRQVWMSIHCIGFKGQMGPWWCTTNSQSHWGCFLGGGCDDWALYGGPSLCPQLPTRCCWGLGSSGRCRNLLQSSGPAPSSPSPSPGGQEGGPKLGLKEHFMVLCMYVAF